MKNTKISKKMKKALIIGISGQDGTFLAKLLLENNYEVHGTSRDSVSGNFSGLKKLDVFEKVTLHSMSLINFRSVQQTILRIEPDEIYNLAGLTSVGLSFTEPVDTIESIAIGTLNILEVIRFFSLNVRFYNASSSECFGNTFGNPANEDTPFQPRSPYAVSKATAFWLVANYREAYNIYACSGILFNHESYLRPDRFVTKKIIKSVCNIKKGKQEKLNIGRIDISRDWGWAPEYVVPMNLMLQQENPEDFVIATGKSISLERFIELSFDYLDLNYKNFIHIDESLMRPVDILESIGDPSKAYEKLGWKAENQVEDVIKLMIEAELNKTD